MSTDQNINKNVIGGGFSPKTNISPLQHEIAGAAPGATSHLQDDGLTLNNKFAFKSDAEIAAMQNLSDKLYKKGWYDETNPLV